jgi:hypothetical protein
LWHGSAAHRSSSQRLAAEYVDAMRNGQYNDDDEYRALSSARTTTHDELIAMTGLEDRSKMYGLSN